ncbi:sugar ABC transporter ATP-binding protein [Candidatus Latescibacterota bacterium]
MAHNTPVTELCALSMTGVTKSFPGTVAVDNVDFEVRCGEVHALMGENGAGKSTLMKILAGSFADYSGRISIDGADVRLHSPSEAKKHGIGMIYQELSLARPLSIAENILAGELPSRFGFLLDKKKLIGEAKKRLARVQLDLDPMTPVEDISQHEAQLVEIAKVLGSTPKILVMDEPTSALSREEVERLFEIIDDLRRKGLTIIYISHHLPEIFRIADRITVLRDGKKIATCECSDITPEDAVQMMVGQSIDTFYKSRAHKIGEKTIEIKNLTRKGFFHDVSFHAGSGEILGVAGLNGAGRTELARSICGLDPVDSGDVILRGSPVRVKHYGNAVERGLAYLTEDRKTDGLFHRLSVRENLVAALVPKHTKSGFYDESPGKQTADYFIEALKIATSSPLTTAGNLSGGNQQKVLLGKWLAADLEVLILDEPTRGVDVPAKKLIHDAILDLVAVGKTVLLLSSDLPELVGLADRVMVMKTGRIIGEMSRDQLTEESVLLAINGRGDNLYE